MIAIRVWVLFIIAAIGLATPSGPTAATTPIRSYAIINDDASLRVRGKTIRLFGVFIPDSGRQCRTRITPVRCSDRAAVLLNRVITGFVTCRPQVRHPDGSLGAFCSINNGSIFDPPLDLGEFLISEGLAVAAPGAPFSYQIQQEIARENQRGIWGFFADDVRSRRRSPFR